MLTGKDVSNLPAKEYSLDQTLALLRADLKRSFPGVKFSVVRARGTAYGWVSVTYEGGPAYELVTAITDGYEGQRFDGMDDSYHTKYHVEPDAQGKMHRVIFATRGINVTRLRVPEPEPQPVDDGPDGTK